MTNSRLWSPYCSAIVGTDENGRPKGCGQPRCEEAGRRRLCLEHWRAVTSKQSRVEQPLDEWINDALTPARS